MDVFWQLMLLLGGGIVGVVFTRWAERWFNAVGDHELWIDYTAVPLTLGATVGEKMGVKYVVDDRTMRDPHNVSLFIWRLGKRDVRPDSFAGEDLTIEVGAPIAPSSLVSNVSTGGAILSFDVSDDRGEVRLKPSLVRPGFVANYEFITDGVPQLQTHNPVADLKISSFYGEKDKRNLIGPVLIVLGLVSLLGAFAALIVFGILYRVAGETWVLDYIWVTFPLMMGGFISLAVGSSISPRRARLARRKLRSMMNQRVLSEPQVSRIFSSPEGI